MKKIIFLIISLPCVFLQSSIVNYTQTKQGAHKIRFLPTSYDQSNNTMYLGAQSEDPKQGALVKFKFSNNDNEG